MKKVIERDITFAEAMNLWKQGKCICFELNGTQYALNAPYNDENKSKLTSEEIEKSNWTELVVEKL